MELTDEDKELLDRWRKNEPPPIDAPNNYDCTVTIVVENGIFYGDIFWETYSKQYVFHPK